MDEKSTVDSFAIIDGHGSSSKDRGKRKMAAFELCDDVQLLSQRLEVLEEEDSKMKKALVVSMDERKEVIREIWQLFQTIQTHSSSGAETNKQPLTLCQERRYKNVGLLQALCEDSNPSLVMRIPISTDAIACLEEEF